MKNKGFVFVETIVVIVILSLGLVMVYQSFVNVLSNNKRRASYNDISYIYRTYYIEDFLTNLNLEDYIDYYLGPEVRDGDKYVHGGKKVQVFSCNNPILYNIDANVSVKDVPEFSKTNEGVKLSFCEQLRSTFKVKNIYITNYNVNDIKKCTTRAGKLSSDNSCNMSLESNRIKFDALNQMTPSMIYYLRTLNGTEDNTYRLIVEYEEEVIDADKTITKVKKNGVLKCPSAYQDVGGICQKKVTKRYYSNVALVKKDSSSALITKILGLGTSDLLYDGADTYGDYKTSDNNLRYVGTNPKNYIYFNCATTVADQMNDSTCEKWRIIGVFNNIEDDNGNKASRVKIIREQALGDYSFDTSDSSINGGWGINQWGSYETYEGADLMRELNTDYLGNITVGTDGKWFSGLNDKKNADIPTSTLNNNAKNMIQEIKWNIGSNGNNENSNWSTKNMYIYERSESTGKTCSSGPNCNDNVDRTTSWKGSVALMYPSDYGYSTSGGVRTSKELCLNTTLYNWGNSDYIDCKNNSWLVPTSDLQWTLSPRAYGYSSASLFVIRSIGDLNNSFAYHVNSVHPTVFLKSNVQIVEGSGSSEKPYKLIMQ
jgi:hypothetical protein